MHLRTQLRTFQKLFWFNIKIVRDDLHDHVDVARDRNQRRGVWNGN